MVLVALFSQGHKHDLRAMEDLDNATTEELKLKGFKLQIGDRVFQLDELDVAGEDALLRNLKEELNRKHEERIESLRDLLARERREAQERIEEVQSRLDQTIPAPRANSHFLRESIHFFRELGEMGAAFMIPATYSPKYVQYQTIDEIITKAKIGIDLCHSVWLALRVNRHDETFYTHAALFYKTTEAGLERVEHYHSLSGNDCLGDSELPGKLETFNDILKAREIVRNALDTINLDSLADRRPVHCPDLEEGDGDSFNARAFDVLEAYDAEEIHPEDMWRT